MTAKNIAELALAATLFAPKLAVEDGLRELGVDVPKEGLLYNDRGMSIMDCWESSAPAKVTVNIPDD